MPELTLITPPKPVEQTYPRPDIQVSPQGVRIAILLAPGIELSSLMLDETTVNQLMTLWLESRKAIKQELGIIQQIKQSRND